MVCSGFLNKTDTFGCLKTRNPIELSFQIAKKSKILDGL